MIETLFFLLFFGLPALWLIFLPFRLMTKGGGWIIGGIVLLAAELAAIWFVGIIIVNSITTF